MSVACFVNQSHLSKLKSIITDLEIVRNGQLKLIQVNDLAQVPDADHDLLVIAMDRIENHLAKKLRALRLRSNSPVLIAAQQIAVTAYQELAELRGLAVVQEPFGTNALPALIQKSLQGELLTRESTPRFLTNEPVRLLDTKTGLLVHSRMMNYSPTGAFLQYAGISLQVGSRLRLDFVNASGVRAKPQYFDAKVIWIKDAEAKPGTRGVGVQFMRDVAL